MFINTKADQLKFPTSTKGNKTIPNRVTLEIPIAVLK